MLRITEYWNKVVDDPTAKPFGKRVTEEYEVKSQFTVNNTLADLKARHKKCPNPKRTVYPDKIIEDMGREWGIHLYKVIEEV